MERELRAWVVSALLQVPKQLTHLMRLEVAGKRLQDELNVRHANNAAARVIKEAERNVERCKCLILGQREAARPKPSHKPQHGLRVIRKADLPCGPYFRERFSAGQG